MIRVILSLFFVAALPTESQAQDTNREIERIYYINESVEICQPPTELVHLPGVRGEPYFLKYSNRDLSETYLTIVIWGKDIPILEIDTRAEKNQMEMLSLVKNNRDNISVKNSLEHITRACSTNDNLVVPIIKAAKNYCKF